jgi:hypothetical protein
MTIENVLAQIDAEIANLQRAKEVLTGTGSATRKRRPGRPPMSAQVKVASAKPKKKRRLSPEGRARIAEAARRRWAAQKKAAKNAA